MSAKTNRPPVHKIPTDLARQFKSNINSKNAWQDITPLARNEWICWIISAKLPETRTRRLTRAIEELSMGKRRPCCFAGCPHR